MPYHIGFEDARGAKYAILPGDPGRVEKIARRLENPEFLAQNREFTTWTGGISGENVLVCSTGIGGPSAAIAVEELFQVGVRTFIRVGTCGGMALSVKSGELVIAQAAIRQDGTSREYVPVEFPAVADFGVTTALVSAAKSLGAPYGVGVVQSKDSFYGQHSPERMPASAELEYKWNAWLRAGCLASEMECAALFTAACSLGASAGCVLSVVWNQERKRAGFDERDCHDGSLAIETAVEAVRRLIG
ncbi:MAG: uridine phosphorylase [Oscillospiraceae bacterium]|jgi:uridine phosphorylase|nr:uridine phosphorylase [Oscillospiraceae bacterium]